MFKRSALPLFVALFSAGVAFANPTVRAALTDLNAEVVNLLTPFQNDQTKAELVFDDIQTNATNALALRLHASFDKIGSVNTLNLKVDELSYDYAGGIAPTTVIRGSIGLDFTKMFAPEEINELTNDLEATLKEYAGGYIEEYGSAVTIKALIDQRTTDTAGNTVSMSGVMSFAIDLGKLPANKKVEDVMLSSGQMTFKADFKTGASLDVRMTSNPAYHGFREDESGLKDILDRLLARDPDLMSQLSDLVGMIDGYAGNVVEGNF